MSSLNSSFPSNFPDVELDSWKDRHEQEVLDGKAWGRDNPEWPKCHGNLCWPHCTLILVTVLYKRGAWLFIIVNLTGFGITWETHPWTCLWGCFQSSVAGDGRRIWVTFLCWGSGLDKREKESELNTSAHLSAFQLWKDLHDFPVMRDCVLKTRTQKNSSSLSCVCYSNRKMVNTGYKML